MEDNATISLYIRGIYSDERGVQSQDTDVHLNSDNGEAVFNWRMKFSLKYPSSYNSIRFQLWSYALLSHSIPIGETILDLGKTDSLSKSDIQSTSKK